MRKKNRRFLSLLGILVGGLVIAVSLPGGEDEPPGTSAWDRVCWVCDGLMEDLGLRCARRGCVLSTKTVCITNLKQIDGAKATWALENKKSNTDIPTATELSNYITDSFILWDEMCPGGGKYVIGSVQQKPLCSLPGHTL